MKSLLSVSELARELSSSSTNDWVILDCRFDLALPEQARLRYQQGHLPGAFFVSLEKELSGPKAPGTGRHPLPSRESLRGLFSRLGIRPETRVFCYDDSDHAGAARAWWLLKWMGHDSVAVLDGGFSAWKASGNPIDTTPPAPRAPSDFAAAPGAEEERVARMTASFDQAPLLIDSRAPERYRGEVEPIDPVAGHIPGARNFFYKSLLQADGRFRPAAELRELFTELQARIGACAPFQDAVFYCGSGVTACVNLLGAEVAGLGLPRLYPGSWSEYCQDRSRPVEKG